MILRLFFFLLCIGFRLLASSQTPTPIKWGQFISKTTEKTQLTNNQTNYYLVKLGGNTSNTKNQLLKKTVQRKLDSQHAIVSLSEKDYKLFKNHFQAIWQTNNLWKYSPNLLNMSDNKTYVFLVKTKLPNQLKALIKENTTIETTKILNNLFILKASLEDIEKRIAPANHVYYIGLESMYPKTESKIAELDLSVNGINRIHHQYISLTNADQTISVKDHMFDENDLDLAGKKVTSPTASDTIDPHATAMATIIAGAGNTSSHGKGVAFKSKITSSYFRNLLPDTFSHLSNLGVSVQNHSYGTKIENFYGSVAEAYDEFCYSHPEFLHLFSSGNTGDSVSQNGYYQNIIGYANITGNYKMSKNTLCIGAMDFNDKTATFSSKGPAHDGRIKPELVAYSFIGTSNSTALISGLGMLLQQQYKNQFGHLPLSSLIKACLINSATDIDAIGPDFTSGYGNINGYDALMSIKNNNFFIDELTDGETKSFVLNIPSNSCKLKITLVWTDPPAQENNNIALVNDLDLKLTTPNTNEWLPWVLDASADTEKLSLPATRKTDHLNNIEQITLENPETGTYTINVSGYDISTSIQKFSLVYQWSKKDTFEWSYPTGSDAIALGESPLVKLKWQNTYSNKNGELSVSFNLGATWQIINNQALLENNKFLWTPEAGINSIAILKMKINNMEYISDTFAISSETNTRVALDCDEIIELTWNESPNAQFYNIYNYKNKEMVQIATRTDTSFAFTKGSLESTHFAVEPIFLNNYVGQRSETIDYSNFGAECYFDSFYALSNKEGEKQGVEVFIGLGSNYEIDKLELYRLSANSNELINDYYSPTELMLTYFDTNPLQGLNQYQLIITLKNGKQYYSEIASAYFLSDKAFLLFPNPTKKDGINIYTKNFGDTKVLFTLFDVKGQRVIAYQLESDREFVKFNGLQAGTYIYKLESTGGITESSVLIVY